MTIDKHIAAIRGMLDEYNERGAPFTDQQIYHHFSVTAAEVQRQKIDRDKSYNVFTINYYCVGLEPGTVHDCNCIDVGCDVMRSRHMIPDPVHNKTTPLLRVRTLDHKDIPFIDASAANSINLDPVRRNKLHYSVVNSKIVLWNTRNGIPKAVLVGGLFIDPLEWANIQLCDDNGNDLEETCFNAKTQDFPVDGDLLRRIYTLTVQALIPAANKKEDRINDQG